MNPQNYQFCSPLRASAVLTTGYVAAKILGPITNSAGTVVLYNPSQYNQLEIYFGFTIGSLTSAELKIEFSHDGTTFFQETYSSVSAGVSTDTLGNRTYAASGNYRIAIPCKANYIKISVKGTGTVTNSLAQIDAVLAVV